jgi:hypothetical protein
MLLTKTSLIPEAAVTNWLLRRLVMYSFGLYHFKIFGLYHFKIAASVGSALVLKM